MHIPSTKKITPFSVLHWCQNFACSFQSADRKCANVVTFNYNCFIIYNTYEIIHFIDLGKTSRCFTEHPHTGFPTIKCGDPALVRKHDVYVPSKHKTFCTMFDQRRRRWTDVVQMLYKWFVFAGI